MLFNSVPYLIFLPVVGILYYLLVPKHRWLLLLASSYFFYAFWKIEFLGLILISTLVDYLASNRIGKSSKKAIRRLWLSMSLMTNLGLLFLFKYLKLFLPPQDLMQLSIKAAEYPLLGELYYSLYLIIPVGISFYTFQTMSYTLDVFWGKIKPERHLGKFALFVSFFPQLVAGPIERFANLRPQFDNMLKFDPVLVKNGLRLLLFGFFLKLCIADNLAQTVNPVYDDPSSFSALNIIIGTFLFGLQIYGDFAGYSLIAQGSAMIIGIKLMDNFRTPYLSRSIAEFWQRWHISLSTWFRDYLYIPLGGNRVKFYRWIINILLVFTISGFWHGAEWTFLIWGGIHGVFYLLEYVIKRTGLEFRGQKYLGWLATFIVVSIAWVFFRAGNMESVQMIIDQIKLNSGNTSLYFSEWFILPAGLFLLFEWKLYNGRFDFWIDSQHAVLRWFIYGLLIFCILALAGAVNHPFIYFQF